MVMENVQVADASQSVAFNMSMQLVGHIFNLLQRADEFRRGGSYLQEFECLRRIKYNFIQCLTNPERDNLISKEGELRYYIIADAIWNETEGFSCSLDDGTILTSRLKAIISRLHRSSKLPVLVDEYRTYIMDLLESKGFLVKKLSDLKIMF